MDEKTEYKADLILAKQFKDSYSILITKEGHPVNWNSYVWFINCWRLFVEQITIRVLIDVAIRCPEDGLAKIAYQQINGDNPFVMEELDKQWPGRGDFRYGWKEL